MYPSLDELEGVVMVTRPRAVGHNDRKRLLDELRRDAPTAMLDDDLRARHGLLRYLIRLRRDRRVNQHQVAQFMGTTQSAVSDLENGVTDARLSTIQKYARALGCRLDFRLSEGPLEHFNSWQDRSFSYSSTMRDKVEYVDMAGWAEDAFADRARRPLTTYTTRDIAVRSPDEDAYSDAVSRAVKAAA
ncbi:helix-turn-helix transcriptional regulator [Actinoplanes sp. NPDC048791]|uniref:helix-turn-helix domain-containing protein n=1 Tax=Actinoplanes sp. NPDC048791 TaxID=3154623 RepID=UPI00340FAC0F